MEFQNDKDAERALSATHFTYTVKNESGRRCVQLQIKVSPHRTRNSSRGVIYCPDLEDTSDDDIVDGLAEYGVTAVRRFHTKKGGVTTAHNLILTFNRLDLLREVFVEYLSVRVHPYIPVPMRCFSCLRFGHTRTNCWKSETCGKCAST